MSSIGGANKIKDGLVFGYDTGYPMISSNSDSYKFNKGEPTTNLITTSGLDFTQFSSYGNLSRIQVADPNSPSGYACEMEILDGVNINPAARIAFGSTTYMPSSGNALVSIYAKFKGGPSSNIIPYTYNGSGTAWQQLLPLDGGSHYLTPEYRRFGVYSTITSNPGFSMTKGNSNNQTGQIVRWHSPQVTLKSHSTPFTNNTRSSTESLIDLKRTTDIDVSNVSFDSNAQMVFDGTDDYFVSSDSLLITGDQTWEIVAMANGAPDSPAGILTNHHFQSPQSNFGINYVGGNRLGASIGYTNGTREYSSKNTSYVIQVGVPFHAVLKYSSSNNTIEWFINGTLDSTYSLSATPNFISQPICSGRWTPIYNDYYFNGKVYVGKVYNRALTTQQIKQNFNSLRERFGI